jgi:hypothetical protein
LLTALENALRAAPPTQDSQASRPALPPLPAGISQPLRPSRLTVADLVSAQATLPSSPEPAPSPVSAPVKPPVPQPTAKPRSPLLWALLGSGVFGCIAVAFVAGMLWKNQPGFLAAGLPPPALTTVLTATQPPDRTAAPAIPTAVPPTPATRVALTSPLPTATPPQATVAAAANTLPSATPPAPAATSVPTEIAPTALPAPTVKYPGGKRFVVYYDANSLYLLNASQSIVDIPYVIFERLLAGGGTANRFTGSQWYKYAPTSRPTWCMALKIQGSPAYLNPPECGHNQVYLSVLFPARNDRTVFWTPQADSQQFRVLWKGSGVEEEVARCEIAAQTCEVFFP